jgi:hypothetical protein
LTKTEKKFCQEQDIPNTYLDEMLICDMQALALVIKPQTDMFSPTGKEALIFEELHHRSEQLNRVE